MDWSHIDMQYIHTLEFVTYWLLIALWTALPFCGIVVLVYAACKWGQSIRLRQFDKEYRKLLEKADPNGR